MSDQPRDEPPKYPKSNPYVVLIDQKKKQNYKQGYIPLMPNS